MREREETHRREKTHPYEGTEGDLPEGPFSERARGTERSQLL